MSGEFKTTIVDGKEVEEMGPYCDFCGAHMGEYYDEEEGTFPNPHGYDSFGDNKCPDCGMTYYYDEGQVPDLTDEEKEAVLAIRRRNAKSGPPHRR